MTSDGIVGAIISPSIGIARIGDSPAEFFIGPEVPGRAPRPSGGFKDKLGRIKRQAARFRVYGTDASGDAIGEITASDARIEWNVHLANKKSEWFEFHGRLGQKDIRRNKDEANRAALVIDPGARSISGREQRGAAYRFDSGAFRSRAVPLGELRTDEDGRLLVLGGFGKSEAVPPGRLISNYANNNDWHDDISDGPVTAKIVFPDGREIIAVSAHVLCVPPKFVPELENVVTLYDVLEFTWFGMDTVPRRISFTEHVYPIFRRIAGYPWVNALAYRGHSAGKGGDLLAADRLAKLASNDVANRHVREAVFRRVRNPNIPFDDAAAIAQANYSFMPALAGDMNGPTNGDPKQWLRVRPSQYAILEAWAAGDFEADWKEPPQTLLPLDDHPVSERPALLTKAALLPCVGGAFYPGIEMTYIAEDKDLFAGPFRFDPAVVGPGDVTKWMACPWQADFYECNTAWWPIARPDDVVTEKEYDTVVVAEGAPGESSLRPDPDSWHVDPGELLADRLATREPWDRGLLQYPTAATAGYEGDAAMVELWSQLGFVVSRPTSTSERVFVETERDPFLGMDYRKFYYYLCNIDDHPEFLPKVKKVADRFLRQAWAAQDAPDFPDTDRFFPYTEEAFEARLQQVYTELVEQNDAYDPANDPLFKTRDAVLYRILQMAPFNQNDGAWIHSITPAGPLNEVDSLLFNIWMDEAGEGNIGWSHCNLYTNLLRGLGLYLPDPRSREYAQDPRLLDSAFTVPLMELALAQFPETYYPELLGFTLQLEWTVVSLKPTIKLLDYFGIDSHFYRLHVGIDNAVAGHGAKARQAVKLYLDDVRRRGGDEAMQQAWRRIWNGWIAFDTTGTLFRDMAEILRSPMNSGSKVRDIIVAKQQFAAQNHTTKKVGANYLNDWFNDPDGLMDTLVNGGYFVKGKPEQSKFFSLTGFEGPMFKVFTNDELQTLQQWVVDGCPAAGKIAPPPADDYAVLMAETITALQMRQVNAAAHSAQNLAGSDIQGRPVAWSVARWFDEVAARGAPAVLRLMQALADPANGFIVPGDPDSSRFVTSLLAPRGAMGAAFDEICPRSSGITRRQVAYEWIRAGCPLPVLNTRPGERFSLANAPEQGMYPRQRVRGNGAAH